jgi:hypothetical protein
MGSEYGWAAAVGTTLARAGVAADDCVTGLTAAIAKPAQATMVSARSRRTGCSGVINASFAWSSHRPPARHSRPPSRTKCKP